jgi:putative flippase GtrA
MSEPAPAAAEGDVTIPGGMTGQRGLLFRLVRDQRIAFLLVGGFNTAAGFALFVIFDLTVGHFIDGISNRILGSLATLACAHIVAVLIAFVMYRTFVFRVRGHVWRDLLRFQAVYLVSTGINALVLPLLVQLGMNRILAQLLFLVVSVLISYFGHKNFSFRRSAKDHANETLP